MVNRKHTCLQETLVTYNSYAGMSYSPLKRSGKSYRKCALFWILWNDWLL